MEAAGNVQHVKRAFSTMTDMMLPVVYPVIYGWMRLAMTRIVLIARAALQLRLRRCFWRKTETLIKRNGGVETISTKMTACITTHEKDSDKDIPTKQDVFLFFI